MSRTYPTGRSLGSHRSADSPTPLRHLVEKDEQGQWIINCNDKPTSAIYDYKGYAFTVTCTRCRRKITLMEEAEKARRKGMSL